VRCLFSFFFRNQHTPNEANQGRARRFGTSHSVRPPWVNITELLLLLLFLMGFADRSVRSVTLVRSTIASGFVGLMINKGFDSSCRWMPSTYSNYVIKAALGLRMRVAGARTLLDVVVYCTYSDALLAFGCILVSRQATGVFLCFGGGGNKRRKEYIHRRFVCTKERSTGKVRTYPSIYVPVHTLATRLVVVYCTGT